MKLLFILNISLLTEVIGEGIRYNSGVPSEFFPNNAITTDKRHGQDVSFKVIPQFLSIEVHVI